MTSPHSASAPTSHDDKVLQGRYRITRCLGSGGMGDVYLAEDLRLGRLVAVKSIKQEFCEMPEVRKRIERECVMHAQLGAHPNVITLYDRVEDNNQIHLIIEYVDGTTLKDVIEKARLGSIFLTWRESVSIACHVLEALARIHAQGIVHRDVKPANIMLTQSDTGAYTGKLMDFGIARLMNPVDGATMLTREGGTGPGTPIYMSPEQIAGTQFGPLSPASDVYAMGVVLYQMLAKRPPFQGTITDIFHGHLNASPPPIDAGLDSTYPPQLSEIVQKALAKQPSNRFASAVEFRYALKRLTKAHGPVTTLAVANTIASQGTVAPAGAPVPMPPATVKPTTTNGLFRRRHEGAKSASRTFIAIAIVLAAVLAVLLGNFFFFRSIGNSDTAAEVQQQSVTAVAPAEVGASQSETPSTVAPPDTPPPSAPEQPMPVSMESAPQSVKKETADAALDPAIPSTPKHDSKESEIKSSSVKPPDVTPIQPAPPQQTAPKETPPRTPVPRQTPIAPDISVPTQESGSFSERARQPAQEAMTPGPTPNNANIFQDVQVTKKPAIKVN